MRGTFLPFSRWILLGDQPVTVGLQLKIASRKKPSWGSYIPKRTYREEKDFRRSPVRNPDSANSRCVIEITFKCDSQPGEAPARLASIRTIFGTRSEAKKPLELMTRGRFDRRRLDRQKQCRTPDLPRTAEKSS